MSQRPTVLFVCPHNANRSQMAAGYAQQLAEGRLDVRSAGPTPAEALNPLAVEAMAEEGIDISRVDPQLLTEQLVADSDVVITLGCADAVTARPELRSEDWSLTDPGGRDIDSVRRVRDGIKQRVEGLIASLS